MCHTIAKLIACEPSVFTIFAENNPEYYQSTLSKGRVTLAHFHKCLVNPYPSFYINLYWLIHKPFRVSFLSDTAQTTERQSIFINH